MRIRLFCLFLFTLLVSSGCSGFAHGDQALGYVSTKEQIRIIPVADREDPIALSGTDLYGRPLALPTSSQGATILNVWWSGCTECRSEASTLRELASGPDKAADFYGIDIRESGSAQAQRFEERYRIPYSSFYDPGGRLLLALRGRVPYTAIPSTIVLDDQMRVAAVVLGVVPRGRTMRDVVAEALEP